MAPRLILASASPARLAVLRGAGIDPEVIVSGVDEEGIGELPPADLAATLASLKGDAVVDRLLADGVDDLLVVGCDSVLELDGTAYGKPHDPAVAVARWRAMRGRRAVLHTGHHAVRLVAGERRAVTRVGSTGLTFADLDDAEIEAYVATGEPLQVAGAFAIDGLGGAYVTALEGDHHNVVGLSLPLLREMVRELGVAWHDLWNQPR